MTTTPEQRAELQRLAEEAIPGPWWFEADDDAGEPWEQVRANGTGMFEGMWVNPSLASEKNLRFIAASNPEVVLALLKDLEQAERWKEEALPVLKGLQELGRGLELPLGTQITSEQALAAAAHLHRANAVLHERALKAEATLARVKALADSIDAGVLNFIEKYEEQGHGVGSRMSGEAAAMHVAALSQVAAELRVALAEDGAGVEH